MKASKRTQIIKPSLTRKLFNMAKQYDDVIDLTLGDPDLSPPAAISDAAYRSMRDNKLHYSANAGLREAREAIAGHIEKCWGLQSDIDSELIVTIGGMEALYLSMLALVDPGDEVVVFAPYYVNYIQMIELCGGKPAIVNAYDEEQGFVVNREAIEDVINEKTVAIIVNSPNNPTGDILDRKELQLIAEIAEKNDLVIISDEVYRTLIYDDAQHESILQFKQAQGRTILIDSLSKEYGMTGWRIGYAYGPACIISNMIKFQENVAACATVSSQYALIEAYNNELPNQYILNEFAERRDYLFNEIQKIDFLKPLRPKGTFYMFVNIAGTGMKSKEFCYHLLEHSHIAVVPGVAYGDMYDDYIRIAFTKDITLLQIAVERMKEYFKGV